VVCQGTGVSRFFFINFCRKVSVAGDGGAVSPACLKERQLRSARQVVVVVRDSKPVRNFFLLQRFFLWEHGLIRQKRTNPHAPKCPHTPGIHLQLLLLLCDLPLRVLVILLVSNANISDILLRIKFTLTLKETAFTFATSTGERAATRQPAAAARRRRAAAAARDP
jgi:hypothetical protein